MATLVALIIVLLDYLENQAIEGKSNKRMREDHTLNQLTKVHVDYKAQ